MSSAGNEAVAKVPTVEEEMAKFQGFSVRDGEAHDGKTGNSPADERAAAEEAERVAAESNRSTHSENQKRQEGGEQQAPKGGKIALTDQEEADAIQAATDKKGDVLTEDEADAAVGEALNAKQKAADKVGRKKDANARIGELTRARRTAERERDTATARTAELERRLAALERGEKPAPLTNDTKGDKKASYGDKPDHTDTEKYQYGELDAKYIADLARWETLKAIAESKEGEQNTQKSQQDAEALAAFNEAKAAFEEAGIEQFDDFEEVVIATYDLDKTDPGYWPLSQTMGELLLESEHGPAIAYQLASDPKEARRLEKLSSARQAAWFGVQEAKLSAGSAASTDKKSEEDGEQASQAEARKPRQLPQPRNSQVRESKAPLPLPSNRKMNGAGGNRMPSSATTDFSAFEALATGQHR